MDDDFCRIFNVLVAHAGAEPEDEFTPVSIQGTDPKLLAAITAEKERKRQEEVEEVASAVVELEGYARKQILENVSKIRTSRREQNRIETESKRQISKIELALFYASETSNFLPLIVLLNPSLAFRDEILLTKGSNFFKVPEDYVNKFNTLKEKEKNKALKASKKAKK